MNNKTQIVYSLDNINADDGVDIFEIAPILMSFGELIRSSGNVLGLDQKIDVKVKPFEKGSWITEFVVHQQTIQNLLNYVQSHDGQTLINVLSLLGLNAKEGVIGVTNIIRFTKGKVTNFKKIENEKVIYYNDNGEHIEVSLPAHKLTQSPQVQINIYNSVVSPLQKFPGAGSVTINTKAVGTAPVTITEEDQTAFETYAKTELLEEVDEVVSQMSGVFIKPRRGSYSGEEKQYSFYMGESVLWPTTIEDEEFRNKLANGEIRLFHEDVLKVNMEIRQKKDATNKLLATYAITKILEYIEFQRPRQMRIGD